jgi:probable F420-dependent oxidoreductase
MREDTTMRFGLNLPNYGTLGHRDAMVAIAETAEELGFASLWTTDHILLPTTLPDPYGNLLESFTTLSYLAARTERIQLATGVLVLPQRDPLLAAKQAATVHHLSGGRLTLGVGVGWIEQEYRYLRADFHSRGELADEYIPAMRALFEAAAPDFHGAHIDYSDVLFSPKPSVPIRIVVGGTSRAALKRAATLGDGWHGLYQSPERARAAVAAIGEPARNDTFEVSLRTITRVGDALHDVEPGTALDGDAAAIVAQIDRYAAAGVDQLVIEPVSSDLDDFIDQITRFALDVATPYRSADRHHPTPRNEVSS